MKRYKGIVKALKAPNINYLWLKEDGIYYFDISGWKLATNFSQEVFDNSHFTWDQIEDIPNFVTVEALELIVEELKAEIQELKNK